MAVAMGTYFFCEKFNVVWQNKLYCTSYYHCINIINLIIILREHASGMNSIIIYSGFARELMTVVFWGSASQTA